MAESNRTNKQQKKLTAARSSNGERNVPDDEASGGVNLSNLKAVESTQAPTELVWTKEEKLIIQELIQQMTSLDAKGTKASKKNNGQAKAPHVLIGYNEFSIITSAASSMSAQVDSNLEIVMKLFSPTENEIPPDLEITGLIDKLRTTSGRFMLLMLDTLNYKVKPYDEEANLDLTKPRTDVYLSYFRLLGMVIDSLQMPSQKITWNILEVIKFRILRLLRYFFGNKVTDQTQTTLGVLNDHESVFMNVVICIKSSEVAGEHFSKSVAMIVNVWNHIRSFPYFIDTAAVGNDHNCIGVDGFRRQFDACSLISFTTKVQQTKKNSKMSKR